MIGINSRIFSILKQYNLADDNSLTIIANRTRDRDNIQVIRSNTSQVIFLSLDQQIDSSYYENKAGASYFNTQSRDEAIQLSFEDDSRRAQRIIPIVGGKNWVDIGTGAGGILDLVKAHAKLCVAVEPQKEMREFLREIGHEVHCSIEDLPDGVFDLATLFHVYEHFTDPIVELRLLAQKMRRKGRIIIEVPHARDSLLELHDLDSFKDFTFWSEHLILHTRQSLNRFIVEAGLKVLSIEGFQRYPLANHLMWLSKGEPNGHIKWSHLRDRALDESYAHCLARLDLTDTIIATCEVI